MSQPSTPSETPPPIEMRGVSLGTLSYPSQVIAEAIDWTAQAGDYWVVAALQVAGKTDFLLMTAGLMPPAGGSYRFFGEEMPIFDEARIAHRLRLGLVFDGGQPFHHLTVRENVALPLQYHRNLSKVQACEAVGELLESTELTPWADYLPTSIGRMWQKRVGLARALALEPEVLLLDSPLAGMDLRHTRWWLDFLDGLAAGKSPARRPVTLVATAADLRPWQGRARQFAVLRQQRLVVLGTWAQVEAASAELVRELLAAAPQGS